MNDLLFRRVIETSARFDALDLRDRVTSPPGTPRDFAKAAWRLAHDALPFVCEPSMLV